MNKNAGKNCKYKKKYYLCTRIQENASVDLLAQLVEHIPFKDGVLGSNPRQIT